MKKYPIAGVAFAAGSLFALAASAQVSVSDAWVRATVAEQRATGAFMHISSAVDARLVEVRSAAAGVAELHEMSMQDNVMRMRPVQGLDLPAGKTVELKPGGYHIMLMDLKRQVREGEPLALTLVIEDGDRKRSSLDVRAIVRPLSMPAAAGGMPQKHRSH